ncbi:MAG: Cys-tRNA(Pro) deacylase [Oscillospiraceae bacterium]|nr:Cys-tRNA(Pro) deacylase [Oscillospiraceae bacterium]
MAKEAKTNAMRMLDRLKINYTVNSYECDEFIDGVHIADMLEQSRESSFKTLVTVGKSGNYYVFALPVDRELDMKKCARAVGEKSLEMVHVKDINAVTGYIRGGCTPIGMKKQYRTVIHLTARDHDKIIVSGGRLGLQLILAPDDLAAACGGEFADIAAEI